MTLPWAISFLLDLNVSIKRIASFLCAKNLDREWIGVHNQDVNSKTVMSGLSLNDGHIKMTEPDDPNLAIEVSNGNFCWKNLGLQEESKENIFELRDLNISIEKGQLVFIIGKVASGKSSVLYSMMGEVKPFNPYKETDPRHQSHFPPKLTRNGSVSFLSEKPWLMPTTIRENILVGRPLD